MNIFTVTCVQFNEFSLNKCANVFEKRPNVLINSYWSLTGANWESILAQ